MRDRTKAMSTKEKKTFIVTKEGIDASNALKEIQRQKMHRRKELYNIRQRALKGKALGNKNELVKKAETVVQFSHQLEEHNVEAKTLTELLSVSGLQAIFYDLFELAPEIDEVTKRYLQEIIVFKRSKEDALVASGALSPENKDKAAQVEADILKSQEVREFLDIIKMMYTRALPLAVLEEVRILRSKTAKDTVKLLAAKSIKATAGLMLPETKGGLPVTVTVNVPVQNNTKIENKQ